MYRGKTRIEQLIKEHFSELQEDLIKGAEKFPGRIN